MGGRTRTESELLSGLIRLHEILESPCVITRAEMRKETGLPENRLQVLSNNEIIKPTLTGAGAHGRSYTWEWKGPRPNTHMAKKLVSMTIPKPKKAIPLPSGNGDNTVRSQVVVRKEYDITKSLNKRTVTLKVTPHAEGRALITVDLPSPMVFDADQLKCYGFAFMTASEVLSRDSDES